MHVLKLGNRFYGACIRSFVQVKCNIPYKHFEKYKRAKTRIMNQLWCEPLFFDTLA